MSRRFFLKSLLGGLSALHGLRQYRAMAASDPAASSSAPYDCIIVGGGVSGLTAGYLLRHRNILVLEAASRTGGRVISGTWNGWSYAKGADYLGRPEGLFARMIEDFGLMAVEIPPPMDVYLRDNRRWTGTAGRVGLLVENGGIAAFNRLLRALYRVSNLYDGIPDYEPGGRLEPLDEQSCRQWFTELRLPEFYFDLFNVLSRGVFGATLDQVSALSAIEEIAYDFAGVKPLESRRDIERLARTETRTGAFTFENGLSVFSDALTRRLGARCRTGCQVNSVRLGPTGFEVQVRQSDGAYTLAARSVIIATPAPQTRRIAKGVLSGKQQVLLGQVSFAPYAAVTLFSERPVIADVYDMAVPDGFRFTDIYDRTRVARRQAGARNGHITGLTVAPRNPDDTGFLRLSDDELVHACLKDLKYILSAWDGMILGVDVQRFPLAYPVMSPGSYRRLTRLHQTLTGSLQLAGDSLTYPTFEGALLAGEVAARRILNLL
jgi:protoporphyrinogen oxidase